MTPALSIQGLEKTYASGTHALHGVSLEVPAGDFFGLLGPNGAGKTTLIGIVTGLVNKTAGTIKVFGVDIDKEPEKVRAMIGVVPQQLNFNIFEKVLDIVVNQAGYYGIPRSVALPRAEEILKGVGLWEKRFDVSRTLSGGMQRRIMIARALIHEPKFLVLDEPTAGVDVELRRGMWEYLTTLTAKGTTILLTTHYLEEAEQLCRQVAIINKGQIIANGSMKDILSTLKTETLTLDLKKVINDEVLAQLKSFNARRLDENSIEVELDQEHGLSEAITILNKFNLPVQTVRPKSSKLEEVFVRLTANKA